MPRAGGGGEPGSITARQGLREREAFLFFPVLAAAIDAMDTGRLVDDISFCFSAQGHCSAAHVHAISHFVWARFALDAFFLPTMCGAPLALVPCHAIVRAAIISRYESGSGVAASCVHICR